MRHAWKVRSCMSCERWMRMYALQRAWRIECEDGMPLHADPASCDLDLRVHVVSCAHLRT